MNRLFNSSFLLKLFNETQWCIVNSKSYDNLNVGWDDLSFITGTLYGKHFYKPDFDGKIVQLLEKFTLLHRSVLFMSPRQNLSTASAVTIFR